MDTALVPVSQTEKWITTPGEILLPVDESDWENESGAFVLRISRRITPVDNQKTDVVE